VRIPSFAPHPLLKSGHAQTIAAAFLWRRFELPSPEERLFEVDPWSKILGHCHWQPGKAKSAPVLVIVHGLEGSSHSGYVQGIAEKAWQRGYHVIRLNQRNCGGTEALTPTLYNSGMSGDYRAVLESLIAERFEQVVFVGYSMGGNLVSKMAAELAEEAPLELRAVCTVCPALDLAACADALERPENYFYERHFVSKLVTRYLRKARMMPDRYPQNGFGPIRTVREFDDWITAPQFGYRSAQEYYQAASAGPLAHRIRVPFLLITAADDPFVPYASFLSLELQRNASIEFIAPERGGHCGFISRFSGAERFWAEQRIVEFCDAHRRI
jgi:uncharacterized protein